MYTCIYFDAEEQRSSASVFCKNVIDMVLIGVVVVFYHGSRNRRPDLKKISYILFLFHTTRRQTTFTILRMQ